MPDPEQNQEIHALSEEFEMKEYIEATADSAKRTRTVTVILVVASVLVAIGWYNSLRTSWQLQRVRRAFDPDTDVATGFLDTAHRPKILVPGADGKSPADRYREDLQVAAVRAYIENVRFIHAPFFGIAFDVNDLGIIGGVGLVIVLLLMRYTLSREIKNLNVTFREAVHHHELSAFYHAMAMRQVFTVPEMKGEKRNAWLAISPRLICVLPAIVFAAGVGYDYYSVVWLHVYKFAEVKGTLITEALWFVIILYLSIRCWERQTHIDGVWRRYWSRLAGQRTSVIRLKDDLVERFGSDEAVDGALRDIVTQKG
jgi:hypothetical protein